MKEEIIDKMTKSIECKEKVMKDTTLLEMIEKVCREIINAYEKNHREVFFLF